MLVLSTIAAKQARIDVNLRADEALGLIEQSFAQAKTSPTRIQDGGWTIERADDRRLIYPTKPKDFLLEPLPADYTAMFPETLGVQIDAMPLAEGGTRVSVQLIRRRVDALISALAVDIFAMFGGGLPFFCTVTHAADMVQHRRCRRAAKRRLLRLALEPLIPHEHAPGRGPFRA